MIAEQLPAPEQPTEDEVFARLQSENDRETALDALGRKLEIGKFKCYPITLTTITWLQMIESPFIAGVQIASIRNTLLEILMLVRLQMFNPENDEEFDAACALAFDKPKLQKEAMRLTRRMDVGEASISAMLTQVLSGLAGASATKVIPEDKDGKAGIDKLLAVAGMPGQSPNG